VYRINALSGQLVEQIKHLPQNFEVIEFLPLGNQIGMVVVIRASNLIFYSHISTLDNSQARVQAHQGSLLGYCTDEAKGLIYSIGFSEPVIKVF